MINVADILIGSGRPDGRHEALVSGDRRVSYDELRGLVRRAARALTTLGVATHERVAVFLDKRVDTVAALFGAAAAGAVMIPVNPVLKPKQVAHILVDSEARVLVTTTTRLQRLRPYLSNASDLRHVVLVDGEESQEVDVKDAGVGTIRWEALLANADGTAPPADVIDEDLAAIFYTSGSTGSPKGVMVSHRNLIAGAESVASYIGNVPSDRILSVLPISFDAGFSQLTTAFFVGATAVLHNFLVPQDAADLCAKEGITGITGVPPLWARLLSASWPEGARKTVRYFANTGGHMSGPMLEQLRVLFPDAAPYLMYGLTEAFRSTYLPPSEVERRPGSIGKAIPNARVLVVDPEGRPCAPGEMGELVHVGATVSMGYWKSPELTRQRIRPLPALAGSRRSETLAVWSGDLARTDDEGFIYFIGRKDDMIKSAGYRISPSEVEDVVLAVSGVREAVAFGIPHQELGEQIVVCAVVQPPLSDALPIERHCRRELPSHMIPARIMLASDSLPRNPNGKFDRAAIKAWSLTAGAVA